MKFEEGFFKRMKERAASTKSLHVACGRDKYTGAVGVDINPASDAEVKHDLNRFPYPFGDGEFDTAICVSAMEHLADTVGAMKELYRILRPGGRLFIVTPHFSDAGSWIDPTHSHHFSARSFDYFIDGTALFGQYGYYSGCRFRLVERRLTLHPVFRAFEPLANRHVAFYEETACYVLRGKGIYLELEKAG